ncbi:hypothetical protein BDR04DRAFT_1197859 [Suillus decipiens]|nr:hypothetical protein BDR04DRAFT_1197859 [Suillus decipiens]
MSTGDTLARSHVGHYMLYRGGIQLEIFRPLLAEKRLGLDLQECIEVFFVLERHSDGPLSMHYLVKQEQLDTNFQRDITEEVKKREDLKNHYVKYDSKKPRKKVKVRHKYVYFTQNGKKHNELRAQYYKYGSSQQKRKDLESGHIVSSLCRVSYVLPGLE